MSTVANPALAGTFNFTSVVYAAPGLNYTDPSLADYRVYHQPTTDFSTRSIDLSPFADFDASVPWPFANTGVPINGIARIPVGSGPFPLALFAHGNHDPFEHSTPGYIYLCELLASHGIIGATIDVNFLNGRNRGENDGRAIVHLEHIKEFLIWNKTNNHPLRGKVDSSRIMIAGHSRGGEAVGHASLFNRLTQLQPDAASPIIPLDGSTDFGPYNFPLRSVVAIAPTDGQFVPLTGPTRVPDDYFLIHGSRDNDVFNFPGYMTYDRSHAVNLSNPTAASGSKALLWVYGANHNFFNTVWDQESQTTISRAKQEQIAKVYISAIAQAALLGRREYLDLLHDHNLGVRASWLPQDVDFVSQFQHRERLFLQHSEEAGNTIIVSTPFAGVVDLANISARKLRFNLGQTKHLLQETQGVQLTWAAQGEQYRINFAPSLDASEFTVIALRLGQSFETQNPAGQDQDLTLRFEDGSNAVMLSVSSINRLLFPSSGTVASAEPKTVMQTIRIPIGKLQQSGLDTAQISSIELRFDRTQTGRVYLDDLQLTH